MARAFATGDPAAVETVRARVDKILAFRGYGIPREDRKDLEQEVMVQLWRSVGRESFQTGAGFWGFVEVVSTRRCIDWLRSAFWNACEGTSESAPWSSYRRTKEPHPGDDRDHREPVAGLPGLSLRLGRQRVSSNSSSADQRTSSSSVSTFSWS